MRKIIAILFSFSVLILLTQTTSACSCVYFPKHRKAFRDAEAVFVGRVLDVQKNKPNADEIEGEVVSDLIKFKVEKRWKGAKQSELSVWLSADSFCTGWKFQAGEDYLIYAYESGNHLVVSTFCSRNRPLETKDADALKEYKQLNSFWFRFLARIPYI